MLDGGFLAAPPSDRPRRAAVECAWPARQALWLGLLQQLQQAWAPHGLGSALLIGCVERLVREGGASRALSEDECSTALARRLYALQSWACVVLDEVAPAAGVAAAPLRIEPRALQRAAAAAAAAPDGWCRAVLARALKQAPPALLVRVRVRPYPYPYPSTLTLALTLT